MKVAVLLSGCGVYDGAEIQEAVCTLLALSEQNHKAVCFAPNKNQHHVINHTSGEEMPEQRNCMIEAARISRGAIEALDTLHMSEFDALVIVGGFGAAKNINQWALKGPVGAIDTDAKRIVLETLKQQKPLVAICMGPTVVAKAVEGSTFKPVLSAGDENGTSEYDIQGIHQGMTLVGATCKNTTFGDITIDQQLKVISVPAYMMETDLANLHQQISKGVQALKTI